MLDAKQIAKDKKNAYMAHWRLTPAGRNSQSVNIERRSEVRRAIAAAKAVATDCATPGEFDSREVQNALRGWGG